MFKKYIFEDKPFNCLAGENIMLGKLKVFELGIVNS